LEEDKPGGLRTRRPQASSMRMEILLWSIFRGARLNKGGCMDLVEAVMVTLMSMEEVAQGES
jgi:hypothetical protein